jgi:hypothetical protein
MIDVMKEKNLDKNKQHLFEGVSYAHLTHFIDKFDLKLGINEDSGKFDILGYNQEAIRQHIENHENGENDEINSDGELEKSMVEL